MDVSLVPRTLGHSPPYSQIFARYHDRGTAEISVQPQQAPKPTYQGNSVKTFSAALFFRGFWET